MPARCRGGIPWAVHSSQRACRAVCRGRACQVHASVGYVRTYVSNYMSCGSHMSAPARVADPPEARVSAPYIVAICNQKGGAG